MAGRTVAVNVTTAATRLDADETTSGAIRDGSTCTYYNAGSVDVTLGNQTVTAGNGIRLAPGGVSSEFLPAGEKRYAVVAAGTCQVNVDQIGV